MLRKLRALKPINNCRKRGGNLNQSNTLLLSTVKNIPSSAVVIVKNILPLVKGQKSKMMEISTLFFGQKNVFFQISDMKK